MMSLIEQWRTELNANEYKLYVILDSLYKPNPVPLWCEQGWAVHMQPLYYMTPIESILKASPWLCQVATAKLSDVESWLKQHQGAAWGWIYLSEQSWQQQITHWRSYLRIMIDGELRVIRLQDPRVLSIWLSVKEPALWQGLLSPIMALQLPGQAPEVRPHPLPSMDVPLPWTLPAALSDVWHHSAFGIKVAASNFEVALWEKDAQLSESLYQQGGDLEKQLSTWLTSLVKAGQPIRSLTIADVTEWAGTMVQNN